jgi:tetratricopeptide (TPR) repeat protein
LTIFENLGNRANIATVYHQLGIVAENRGEYDIAEQRYQDSLAITEDIGDQFSVAVTHRQLGTLAYRRDDYDTAEQRYGAALTIFEEIGDRAGTASTLSQLGSMRTAQGRPADAVGYQVQALAFRAELGSPATAFDVRMLSQQRDTLGDEQFERILRTHVDNDASATIMQLTKGSE